MMLNRRAYLAAGLFAATSGAITLWWRQRKESLQVPPSLLVAGASTMYALNQSLLADFTRLHPEIQSVLEAGGSLAGLLAVKRGAIDVAMVSRELSNGEDEPGTRATLIAKNAILIATHRDLPINQLSVAQLSGIFRGKVRYWHELGGPEAPIRLLTRKPGSSSLKFMEEVVLEGDDIDLSATAFSSAAELAQGLIDDPHAIGFVALKDKPDLPLKFLNIDGVPAQNETVLSGRYPLAQPLYLVLHGQANPAALGYVQFALSKQGQAIVAASNLIALSAG